MELNRKIAEMSSESGEAAIQRLQDEIKDCKAVLKCGVCFDRPKEVCVYGKLLWSAIIYCEVLPSAALVIQNLSRSTNVSFVHFSACLCFVIVHFNVFGLCFVCQVVIVKCYHLFCNPCIQRNLEIRHRKCPGCGTAFGQSDVRFVKIWGSFYVNCSIRFPCKDMIKKQMVFFLPRQVYNGSFSFVYHLDL